MNKPAFDLLDAKMEQMKRDSIRLLNADLFRDAGPRIPPKPLTWRERLTRRVTRAKAYFSTLWKALKGDDPYDVDWDY